MNHLPLTENLSRASDAAPDYPTRIPRAAQARLLLHNEEADPRFMEALSAALPNEEARLAYLNHLAWQARS
ncbi:MAG: hypothetical protein KDJ28_14065 [Candidatus Competibacteraceae bacterium]|nr:hypothetical protein [Candidatus Competibacteraceae bacterium]